MRALGFSSCLFLTLLVVTNGDLVFIGPGFSSFLKVELIDFSTDSPVSCDVPHYKVFQITFRFPNPHNFSPC